MTNVMFLKSFGDGNRSSLLDLSHEYQTVKKNGRIQSFFSDDTIYDATAFTQVDGTGNETAFLGHADIAPNGRLGFDPSVTLSGEVVGQGFHDFFAAEIGAQHDGETAWQDMLSGDDVIVGNGMMGVIEGYGGNDVILAQFPGSHPSKFAFIFGGDGDDIMFNSNAILYGDGGTDTFVVNTRGYYVLEIGQFDHGVDHVLFDRALYGDIGNRITKANFHVGPAAADADDRLIINFANEVWYVYIDPDGTGAQEQVNIGFIRSVKQPTFHDFGFIDAAKLMPDLSDLFDMGATPKGAFGPDQAMRYDALTHAEPSLPHHGIIQLA